MRRCPPRAILNVIGDSPSFRSKPHRHLLLEVAESPYKEQFKEFWSRPVPWMLRDYGEKPRVGDPVPTRPASTVMVCAFNRHADPSEVQSGAENDYKVLMMFRRAKGRFTKDKFLLPSSPVLAADREEEAWAKVLRHSGVVTSHRDLPQRLCAFRALLVEFNLLLIPPEGGGIAEVQGPPGPQRWHTIVMQTPSAMRDVVRVFELPLEATLNQLTPFRRVITPSPETFRYDTLAYLTTFPKIPCVKLTLPVKDEKLVWVSPLEAVNRFNDGRMDMPSATLILMSELARSMPTYRDICDSAKASRTPEVIEPRLVRDDHNIGTVLLPGDHQYDLAGGFSGEPSVAGESMLRRLQYERDWPYGVRAVYVDRKLEADDEVVPVAPVPAAIVSELNDADRVYLDVPYPKREPVGDLVNTTTVPVPTATLRYGPQDADGFVEADRTAVGIATRAERLSAIRARHDTAAWRAAVDNTTPPSPPPTPTDSDK